MDVGLQPALPKSGELGPHEFVPCKSVVTPFVPWNEMERWNESRSVSQPLCPPRVGQSLYSPKSLPKPHTPDDIKAEVQEKADELIKEFLKPDFIKKPPKHWRWNYLNAIHAKWHRSFFYFISTY